MGGSNGDDMYHVYELLDPISDIPFYIGKGTGPDITRLLDHIQEASKPPEEQYNQLKCNKIKSIISKGYDIQYKLTCFDDETEAYNYEYTLIKLYGRKIDKSGILTNICPGGRGGWANFGKRVYQFTHDGILISEFNSMKSAAKEIGVTTSAIWACLSDNKQNTQCGGFIWCRTPTLLQKHIDAVNHRKKQSTIIYQININGQIMNIFNNTKEATKSVDVNWWSIGSILNSHTKTCKGYFWADNITNHYIKILQCITPNNEIINTLNINTAATMFNLSPSCICRYLKGTLKTVKNYKFMYTDVNVFGNGVGT